jgi:CheY-like chemotaxis protein
MKQLDRVIYIGSNIKYAEKLQELLDNIEIVKIVKIINTSASTVVDCVEEIIKTQVNAEGDKVKYDAFIIQTETKFEDKKYLSESAGLELTKRILFCEELKEYRKKLIICLSFFSHHYLLKKTPDNAILFAPSVKLIDIVLSPEEGAKEIQKCYSNYTINHMDEDEDFDKNLFPYVVISPSEEANFRHTKRNVLGIQRLYRELYFNGKYYKEKGTDADYEKNSTEYENKIKELKKNEDFKTDFNELYFQKLRFLHRASEQTGRYDKNALDELTKSNNADGTEPLKILLIDDKEYWKDFFEILLNGITIEYCKTEDAAKRKIDIIKKDLDSIYDKLTDFNSSEKIKDSEISDPFNFNLVLLDVRLTENDIKQQAGGNTPINYVEFSGIKILKQIKELNKNIPVIMLTASEDSEIIRTAYKEGCDGYFVKETDSINKLITLIRDNATDLMRKRRIGEIIYFLECKECCIPQLCDNNQNALYKWDKNFIHLKNMPDSDRYKLIYELKNEESNNKESITKYFIKFDDENKRKYNEELFTYKEWRFFGLLKRIHDFYFAIDKNPLMNKAIDFKDIKRNTKQERDFKNYKIVEATVSETLTFSQETINICINGTKEKKMIEIEQMKKVNPKINISDIKGTTVKICKRHNSQNTDENEIVDYVEFQTLEEDKKIKKGKKQ